MLAVTTAGVTHGVSVVRHRAADDGGVLIVTALDHLLRDERRCLQLGQQHHLVAHLVSQRCEQGPQVSSEWLVTPQLCRPGAHID